MQIILTNGKVVTEVTSIIFDGVHAEVQTNHELLGFNVGNFKEIRSCDMVVPDGDVYCVLDANEL